MKEKILSKLKSTKGYISGQKLSKEIGVTRTAIWKNINYLKGEGYHIESKTKMGYRLIEDKDLVSSVELKDGLNTDLIGKEIIYFKELDSTNTTLKKMAASNNDITEGTVIFADYQKAGRGRMGRDWYGEKNKNISMSVLLKPDITPSQAQGFSLLAGLSVAQAIEELYEITTEIKWPNDIMIENRKVCGILTEMNSEIDRINYLIIGIGVNVKTNFPKELRETSISLDDVSDKKIKRKLLTQKILVNLEKNYSNNRNGITKELLFKWKNKSNTINREVEFMYREERKKGKVIDVLEDGSLLIEDENGNELKINSGMIVYQNYYERGKRWQK